ncbi:30S ribosomal protein S5 [bacterium]|nr:30S ribosomal protein S5 [bacterium]
MASGNKPFQRGGRRPFKRGNDRERDEFQQKMVDLARVTRVMAGGKRMKFRACMVVGDGKGQVGMAVAKGADVADAINKSVGKAKKHLITVPIIDGTLPHQINLKFKAARLMMKPAKKGNGIKAGGVLRTVLDLAGVKDATAKILGSNNKVNNVTAAIQALSSFKADDRSKKAIKPADKAVKENKEDKK